MHKPFTLRSLWRAIAPLTAAALLSPALMAAQPHSLTFEERVKAQEAIERVYYNHRIWPKENPQPKPPFEQMVPRSVIEAKVTDYLKKSAALDKYWQRPIQPEQLQAEMERMAAQSKAPDMLAELFNALGNDPRFVMECLARPVLADRLLRSRYGQDQRFHANERERTGAKATILGEAAMGPCSMDDAPGGIPSQWPRTIARPGAGEGMAASPPNGPASCLPPDSPEFEANGTVPKETEKDLFPRRMRPATGDAFSADSLPDPGNSFSDWWDEAASSLPSFLGGAAAENPKNGFHLPNLNSECTPDAWDNQIASSMDGRSNHIAVWTGTEMLVWGGELYEDVMIYTNTGWRYNPALDHWTSIAVDAWTPCGRFNTTAVWTGSEMVIWGGAWRDLAEAYHFENTGARYNPLSNSWSPLATSGVPSPRLNHKAVWTGSEMIVWGGRGEGLTYLNTGGRYSPTGNSWAPTSTGSGVPTGREWHSVAWTGSEMIVWGGYWFDGLDHRENTGARYNPSTDSWVPVLADGTAPTGRYAHSAVWTGSQMVVWGGVGWNSSNQTEIALDSGGIFSPASNTWQTTAPPPSYSATALHTAVWTGSEMIVWGGKAGDLYRATGCRYNPLSDTWIPIPATSFLPGRAYHTAVWTDTEMIIWGGYGDTLDFPASYLLNSGGRFDPSTSIWVPMTPGGNLPTPRAGHAAVWTGAEMIVWGGDKGNTFPNTGGRYDPATASWVPTNIGSQTPVGRTNPTAVWTGSEMIVWGGYWQGHFENSGGRYNPATDSWVPTSVGANVPAGRAGHSAVWTGTEMIIWGAVPTNTPGGRYNPGTDSWLPTSVGANVPSSRSWCGAFWTGAEMIVWGGHNWGFSPFNDGGRYNPATDSWLPTSMETGVPEAQFMPSMVWTGTEMLVWGGGIGSSYSNSGSRYNPSTDSWTPMGTGPASPAARTEALTAWTGQKMMVWSGHSNENNYKDGAFYDPATDSWASMAVGRKAPAFRRRATAVAAGNQVIVWGGTTSYDDERTDSGGSYCLGTGALAASAWADTYHNLVIFSSQFHGMGAGGFPPYTYDWDFGDSSAHSTEQNPLHKYTSAGIYTVTLKVRDASGAEATNDKVVVGIVEPQSVTAAGTPTQGFVPLTAQFSAVGAGGVPPLTYYWDFGDGTASAGQHPTHVYNRPGYFTWRVRVFDGRLSHITESGAINVLSGCMAPTSQVVEVPKADKSGFTWTDIAGADYYRVLRGLRENLPALLTDATDFSCYSYGISNGATGVNISGDDPAGVNGRCYYYLIQGYDCTDPDVSLGPVGYATNWPRIVNLDSDCTPICTPISASIASVLPGTTITFGTPQAFKGTGSGQEALTFAWDFHYDGVTFDVEAIGQTPTYTYSAAGPYQVALRVTDSCTSPGPQQTIATMSITVIPVDCGPLVVISQVYGGGGNTGAVYKSDFLELFNRGDQAQDLNAWTVQYAIATESSWSMTRLRGSIPPGGYYLVQEAQGTGGTTNLPTPDAKGTIDLSATSGKVALVNSSTTLSDSCPTGSSIVDLVGYGNVNCYEGSVAAPALTNTTSARRVGEGCSDTNQNGSDFAAITCGTSNPPRNSLTVNHNCTCP